MPELPEVEHLRRSLLDPLIGRTVVASRLHRRDVLRVAGAPRPRDGRHKREHLLVGARVADLARHGKQLAIVADSGRVLLVHLGMSGQLLHLAPGRRPARADHVHAAWRLDDTSRLLFRDPRRFGGLWAYPDLATLREQRWDALGPDALTLTATSLARALARTARPVKAALLDQALLAGLGNIYADEALFDAGIHPLTPAHALHADEARLLAAAIRRTLRQAVASGGSTLRDYVDAQGRAGRTQQRHRVYGRGGRACLRCRSDLIRLSVAQRTTVLCPHCQRLGSP